MRGALVHVLPPERLMVLERELLARARLADNAYQAYKGQGDDEPAVYEAMLAAAMAGFGFNLQDAFSGLLDDVAQLRADAAKLAQQRPAGSPGGEPGRPAAAATPRGEGRASGEARAPAAAGSGPAPATPHAGVTQPAPAPAPPASTSAGPSPPLKGWKLVIMYNAKATREFMEREGWRYLQQGIYDKKAPAAEAEGVRTWARNRADKVEVRDTTPPEGSS